MSEAPQRRGRETQWAWDGETVRPTSPSWWVVTIAIIHSPNVTTDRQAEKQKQIVGWISSPSVTLMPMDLLIFPVQQVDPPTHGNS